MNVAEHRKTHNYSFANNKVFTHGLNTGRLDKLSYGALQSVEDKVKCIEHLASDIELCCSDSNQYIGDIGLYVKGTVCMISSAFCSSWLEPDSDGLLRRHWLDAMFNTSINLGIRTLTYLDNEDKYNTGTNIGCCSECDNIEVILSNIEIVGVWVTGTHTSEEIEAIRKMALNLNVPFDYV